MPAQGAVAAEQEIVAEAVDHQQHQMARPGQGFGRQRRRRRIETGPAEGGGDRAHQVDQAAAAIVGQSDIGVHTGFWGHRSHAEPVRLQGLRMPCSPARCRAIVTGMVSVAWLIP